MRIAELLLDTAEADHDLLAKNIGHGDDPYTCRDLDFMLYAADQKKAELVGDFIIDNRYGRPSVQNIELDNGSITWRLLVQIFAPANEHVVCSLSALMACLSQIYSLEYDGWGCEIKEAEQFD